MAKTLPDEFPFEKVGFDEAVSEFDREMRARVARNEPVDPADLRRMKLTEAVRTDTLVWLDKLPVRVQPRELQVRYPRILNNIYRLWDHGPRCIAYLDDLMRDLRGNRQGFPMAIASELADLRSHRADLERGHASDKPWEEVKTSR